MTAKRSTFRPVWSLLFLIPGGMGVVLAELAVRVPPVDVPVLALFGMAYPLGFGRTHHRRIGRAVVPPLESGPGRCTPPRLELAACDGDLGQFRWPERRRGPATQGGDVERASIQSVRVIEQPGVRDSILSYLAAQVADVICLQECFLEDRRQPWMSADRLQQATGLTHWEEEFKLGRGQDKLFGLAVLSRYPMVAKSAIRFDNDKNNSGMYVDLLVGSDTVRVYNMHLSSIGFEKEDYEDARNVQDEAARLRLYNRLAAAWQKRTDQAEQVAASVAESRIP